MMLYAGYDVPHLYIWVMNYQLGCTSEEVTRIHPDPFNIPLYVIIGWLYLYIYIYISSENRIGHISPSIQCWAPVCEISKLVNITPITTVYDFTDHML